MSWLTSGVDRDLEHSWSESDRFIPRTFVRPALRFFSVEASSAIVMLLSATVALVWANSPWSGDYEALWRTTVQLGVGSADHLSGLTLRDWVNDGAMTLFFLVVALEIKRELVSGDLRDPMVAALPVLAACGGMIAPALIYLVFNVGTPEAHGWGIPMATDIAFAVAVVSLAGNRVPSGAKLFLLTLAIVDDLGAIVVIAVVYTAGLSLVWLAVACASVVVALILRRLDVRSLLPFVALGVACWVSLHESGVHTTLAGVAFGFIAPTWSFYDPARFASRACELAADVDRAFHDGKLVVGEYERVEATLRDTRRLAAESAAPLNRLVHGLTPWVSFLVVPLFAFANAGVDISGGAVTSWAQDRVLLGVGVGLVAGKTVGVFAATWLACRLTPVRLPPGTSWRHVLGLSLSAGIGFTVALFIADLSSTDPAAIRSAKVGILAGSLLTGLLGYGVLRSCPRSTPDRNAATPD